jgi:PleD family two-component response regulator
MESQLLRVLLAEDGLTETGITLRSVCAERGRGLELVYVSNRNGLSVALNHFHPHIAFIGLSLLQPEPYTAVSLLHYSSPRVPLILFAASADNDCVVKCLEAGAHDYMLEGFLDDATLGRVLRSAIKGPVNLSCLGMEKLRTDPTTGLLSHSGFQQYVQAYMRDSPLEVSQLIVSVDLRMRQGLQDIVEQAAVGHALLQIAGQLGRCVRRTDVIAHVAWGRFILLLTDASEACFASLRGRILSRLHEFNQLNPKVAFEFVIESNSWDVGSRDLIPGIVRQQSSFVTSTSMISPRRTATRAMSSQ